MIIDDSKSCLELFNLACGHLPCELDCVSSGREALEHFDPTRHALVMSDYKMEPEDGIAVIRRIRELAPEVPCMLFTGFPDKAIREFARVTENCELFVKPVKIQQIMHSIQNTLFKDIPLTEMEYNTPNRHHGHPTDRLETCLPLLGRSQDALNYRKLIRLALDQQYETPFMIESDDSMACSLIARHLHRAGHLREQEYVELDCKRLPLPGQKDESGQEISDILDAALNDACGGTLFLRDIQTMDKAFQQKLAHNFKEYFNNVRLVASLDMGHRNGDIYLLLYMQFAQWTLNLHNFAQRLDDLKTVLRHIATQLVQFGLPESATLPSSIDAVYDTLQARPRILLSDCLHALIEESTTGKEASQTAEIMALDASEFFLQTERFGT
ncbi:response regulator [Coraliomargarita parva]|uniref:response regulator n=1 Tax=Coraliomargarita parva TaxID=3014050 RepID=UPI0022B32582|nr:response regulator [Coraliomargarita parva]